MPRHQRPSDREWDEEDSWDEDLDDYGQDDQSTTSPCVKCGCEIYDDAVQCPLCGEYQTGHSGRSTWDTQPFWWKLAGLLALVAMLFAVLVMCV